MGDSVQAERDGAVGIVTINRPEVRNAVDAPTATALDAAVALAHEPGRFPQATLRADRLGGREAFDRPLDEALLVEHDRGLAAVVAGGMNDGVAAFHAGAGRGGRFDDLDR